MNFNEGQYEAHEEYMRKEREKQTKDLPPKEKKKHEILNKCMKQLTDAGIPFFMLPICPVILEGEVTDACNFFHNIDDLCGKDFIKQTQYFNLMLNSLAAAYCNTPERTTQFIQNLLIYSEVGE